MARTHVLAFAKLEDAQDMAGQYSATYKVMLIGPTDQVMLARETDDGVVWRSGEQADFHLLIATKAEIIGPDLPGD